MASGGYGGASSEFCNFHLVQNCQLCRRVNQNVSNVEELRAALRDTIVSYRQNNMAALGVAANYENLPELSEERTNGAGAAAAMEPDHGDARPRYQVTVRRSHTSPDSLMSRRTVHPLTPPPSNTPPSSATSQRNAEVTGTSPKGNTSVRKSLDSFLRATRKKLTSRSKRTNSTPSEEQLEMSPTDELRVSPARVPLIVPVTNVGPLEATHLLDRDTAGRQMRAHTTVDYRHYLVPGLTKVTNCGFYWGVMDRYKAEALLDNQPEGTFLLRDSSQDDFIFSVSFRRYGRSLHARVEQWNHKFSFDAHDSGVYKADSVTALLEHYKDPQTCMFFEPMLTRPLNRPQPFSLLHLARAVVCDNIIYDAIDNMLLPKPLQQYLKYYHYRQQIRVRTGTSWIVMTQVPSF